MPPSYTRGQWTRWKGASGKLAYLDAVWKCPSTGTYTTRDGYVGSPGMYFVDPNWRNYLSGGPPNISLFIGYCVLSDYDTDRRRWVVLPTGGHGSFQTWGVNEFDYVSGTWDPD